MTQLRASQVETLRWAGKAERRYHGSFEAADLAWLIEISTASARRRLNGLVKSGHMGVELIEDRRRFFYITQLGKEALEAERK